MAKFLMTTPFLFIVTLAAMCSSKNTFEPSNSAVLVGNPMSMICRSTSQNDKIQWKFRNINVTGEITYYDGSHVSGGFSIIINKSEGTYTLTKNYTRLDDAGIYVCRITNSANNKNMVHSAELIVLQPVCNSSIGNNSAVTEGEVVKLWCETAFLRNPNPVMVWFRNGSEKLIPQNITSKKYSILHEVMLQMNASDDAVMFSFLFYFDSLSTNYSLQPGFDRARNVPDFVFRWNFHAVVYYGPTDIMIVPERKSYNPGDILHCSAQGNPSPIFKWILLRRGFITYGPNLTIYKELTTAGDTYRWLCVATNSESGRNISKQISITINNPLDFILSTVLPVVFLPVVGVLFIILMFRQTILKRCSKRNSVELNAADEQSSDYEDQGNHSSLSDASNPDLLLSPATMADDVIEDETQRATPLESRRTYVELSEVRPLPVPPIYAQLEMDITSITDTETNEDGCLDTIVHYANAGDIHFTGTISPD